MTWLSRLLRRARAESQLDAELRDHIERQIADYRAAGLDESQARRKVRIEFGGLEQVKELCRDARGTRWLEDFVDDVLYGARVLRKHPSFTAAAILSLALGTGANTAIFTLVDAALLKPLPVAEPDRLVELLTVSGDGNQGNAFTWQGLQYLREHASTVDVIASHSSRFFIVVGGAPPELRSGQYVTGDYFPVLGLSPVAGRTLQRSDDRGDAPPVVMLSYRYWKSRFAGDWSTIGQSLVVNDRRFTIVGVTPPSFQGTAVGSAVDIWIPLATEALNRSPSWTSSASYNWLQVIGRIRYGYTFDAARAELSTLYRPAMVEPKLATVTDAATRERISQWRPFVASARSGLSDVRRRYGEPLLVLFVISGLVLLIACVNVANLLLARTNSRRQEVAVRCSLGASRARVIRQLLTESMLLAIGGATAGVALAYWTCEYLLTLLATTRAPMVLQVAPDRRVFLFTVVVALAAGVLFGIAPALRATSDAGRIWLRTRRNEHERRTMGRVLVCVQVAVSVVMLFGAGLFARSLYNIRTIDRGFDSAGVVIVSGDASRSHLDAAVYRSTFRAALERLASIPGAQSAALSQITPIHGGGIDGTVVLEAQGGLPMREARGVYMNRVSPAYFQTMGIPVYSGRDFTWQDTATAPKVALINRTMSRKYFGDANPIGARIKGNDGTYEIIGVVGDAKYITLRETIQPTLFLNWFQQSDLFLQHNLNLCLFTIRSMSSPDLLADAARVAIRTTLPAVAITNVRTLDEQINESIVRERVLSTLSGFFATLGLLLAAIGLYGLMAYNVARRTSEIGIRIALGAPRNRITGMVVNEAMVLVAGGIAAGIVTALWLARPLSTLLFGLKPHDLSTVLTVTLVMMLTGALAAYLPSRRAARIDPASALRME